MDGDANLFFALADVFHLVRGDFAIVEFHASVAQQIHIHRGERFVEFHVVGFLDFGARVGEFLGEVAVVGEEQQTGGVAVEAADRIYAFLAGVAHEFHNVGTAPLVIRGGDVILWFVEQYVNGLFALQHLVSVAHLIGGHHFVTHFGDNLAVDGDGAGGDEHIGFAARADASVGDVFVEAYGSVFFLILQRQHTLFARQAAAFAAAAFDDFGQNFGLGNHIAATRLGRVLVLAEPAFERAVAAFAAVLVTVEFPVALWLAVTVEFPILVVFLGKAFLWEGAAGILGVVFVKPLSLTIIG